MSQTRNNIGDNKIQSNAIAYIKRYKKDIIKDIVGNVSPVQNRVAIFMAGSPGAGKTEFSTHFLARQFGTGSVMRIDPDEIREKLPGYNGQNAYLFQGAVILAVEKILDYVFHNKLHFLLDGTFSHLKVARKNIKRAIKDNRLVQINYVYQPIKIAWNYTREREKVINRKITRKVFDDSCKNAKMVVSKIKEEFRDSVNVDLIVRNVKTNKYKYYFNRGVEDINTIDKKSNLL